MYLIFDTETTGLPRSWKAPLTDTDNWPRCVQIAWQLHDEMGEIIEHKDFLIRPDGFDIPYEVEKIHGISTKLAANEGHELSDVLDSFSEAVSQAKFIVGQNVGFDVNVLGCEFHRFEKDLEWTTMTVLDTCTEKTALLCQIPGGRGGKFKLPNLTELYSHLFDDTFGEAHNATADVEATTRCFLELLRLGHYSSNDLQQSDNYLSDFQTKNPDSIATLGLKHLNLKAESEKYKTETASETISTDNNVDLSQYPFAHLHNHSQFSVLQSTTKIKAMVDKAASMEMPAVALTDSSNLYGAFHFVDAIHKHPINQEVVEYNKKVDKGEIDSELKKLPLKSIIGCELSICKDHKDHSVKDNGRGVVLLAKNKQGYHNLAKMSSIAFVDGFYYVPRIDKTVVGEYKEGLIALSGGLKGEISDLILSVGEKQAEEALLWWKEQFADDFYIELVRHGLEEEKRVNDTLIRFAKKHQVR